MKCYVISIDTLFVYRYVFITNYIRLQTRIVVMCITLGKYNTKHYIMSYGNNIYYAMFSFLVAILDHRDNEVLYEKTNNKEKLLCP